MSAAKHKNRPRQHVKKVKKEVIKIICINKERPIKWEGNQKQQQIIETSFTLLKNSFKLLKIIRLLLEIKSPIHHPWPMQLQSIHRHPFH